MKVLSVLAIIGLILGGCSSQTVYSGGKRIEQYPAKYENRCVDGVCKDINLNYKYERIPKDEYNHLSKEELQNKEEEFEKKEDKIFGNIMLGIMFGVPIVVGVGTGISTATNVGAG